MFKLLAAVFMLLDHIGHILSAYLDPGLYLVLRSIGRLAFPMYAYALARGYNRSSNIFAYFMRILVMAAGTDLLFRLVTDLTAQKSFYFANVLITFALALAFIVGVDLITRSSSDMMVNLRPVLSQGEEEELHTKHFSPGGIKIPRQTGTIMGVLLVLIAVVLTIIINPDYSLYGLLTVFLFQRLDYYLEDYTPSLNKNLKRQRWLSYLLSYALLTVFFSLSNLNFQQQVTYLDFVQLWSILAVLLFPLYERDKKPGTLTRVLTYLFYPVHYVVLLLVRYYLVS